MTTFTYHCKKTGLDTHVDVESLPGVSLDYAIRRGLREYFDNYHASVTTKAHGDKVAEMVAPLVAEAYDRLMAGDVPGSRTPRAASPVAKAIGALGADDTAKVLAFIESLVNAKAAA